MRLKINRLNSPTKILLTCCTLLISFFIISLTNSPKVQAATPYCGGNDFNVCVYKVEVSKAGIPTGFYHSYILIKVRDKTHFKFAKEYDNERFKDEGGFHITSISGQPSGGFPSWGNLISDPGSDKNSSGVSEIVIQAPSGDYISLINKLFNAENTYKDDLIYKPLPVFEYNSNSYFRGMVEKAGIYNQISDFGSLNNQSIPGWDKSIFRAPQYLGTVGCDHNNSGAGVEVFKEKGCERKDFINGDALSFNINLERLDLNTSFQSFNNKLKSIKVSPGWSVKVYDGSFSGQARCITHSMWDLTKDYFTENNNSSISNGELIADRISSIQIFNNSNCSGSIVNNPVANCQGRQNGNYCGSTLGLDSSKLYKCTNGTSSELQACSFGCNVQPQGTADYCNPSSTSVGKCPNGFNGRYCGAGLGSQYEQNSLYHCSSGVATKITACSLGCLQKPPGTDDLCKTTETPTGGTKCPSNGLFCGSTLGLSANNLYKCTNGAITLENACGNGCKINPPGTADACYPAGSGGGGSAGDKVKIYQDSNFTGAIRTEADRDTDEPYRGATYKSIYIPSGWSIILRDQPLNLLAHEECFSQSIDLLESRGGWSTSVESMKVFKTNVCPVPDNNSWVKICKVTGWWQDHQPDCIEVPDSIRDLAGAGFGDNTLKAINFTGNWEAVLFEHGNYGGAKVKVTDNNSDLGGMQPFGYGTSSIQVRRKDPAFFTLKTPEGGEFKSDRSIENMDQWPREAHNTWNDATKYLYLQDGYEVVLFEHAGFQGISQRHRGPISHMDLTSLDRGVSSVQLCRGTCPPGPAVPVAVAPISGESFLPGTPVTFSFSGNGIKNQVEIWGGNLTTPINSGWFENETTWTRPNLAASANPYQWRVKSWNPYGDGNWSPTYSFKIQDIAPATLYVNGNTSVDVNTDLNLSALVSPSAAATLNYIWSPTPKSGQSSPNAVYNWSSPATQTITLTVNNTGGTVSKTWNVVVSCAAGKYKVEYFDGMTLSGTPSSTGCEDTIDKSWGMTGPLNVGETNFTGTGADGDLTIGAGQTFYTDDVRKIFASTGVAGATTINLNDTNGLAVGNEILIVQVSGTDLGIYEYKKITALTASTITVSPALTKTYTVDAIAHVHVSKVMQYRNINLSGNITAHPFDGHSGGIVAFRAKNIIMNPGSTITTQSLGYKGGARTYGRAASGKQGDSLNGLGVVSRSPNYGSGGGGPGSNDGGSSGGGGSYAAPGGTASDPFFGDPGIGATLIYGEDTLASKIFLGSSGGAGGTDDSGWDGLTFGGKGGNGGGIILIQAESISGSGQIISKGEDGEKANGVGNSEHGGGGGGSAGSIKIDAKKFNLTNIALNVAGGIGGEGKAGSGGSGGAGRIRLNYCDSIAGSPGGISVAQILNCEKNNFSARWTKTLTLPVGNHTFTANTDDGVKVWLNDELIINKWYDGQINQPFTKNITTAGTYNLKMEYYEKTGSAKAKLTVAAIPGPAWNNLSGQTINEDGTFTAFDLDNHAVGNGPLTYTFSGNTKLVVTKDANNVVTIVSPANWSGQENITFVAKNPQLLQASTTLTYKVNAVNDLPVVTSTALTSAVMNTAYSYQVTATDVDTTTLTYSLTTKPTGMTISATGLISWTPTTTGSFPVTVKVADSTSTFVNHTFTINVTVTNANTLFLLDGAAGTKTSVLSQTEGFAASTDSFTSAGGVNRDGVVTSPVTYIKTGLNGTYRASETTKFNLFVDSADKAGNAAQMKIHYDFTGDGTYDRTETFNYYATNNVVDWQEYKETSGLKSSTGAYANLQNGKIRVDIWSAIGTFPSTVRTSATTAHTSQSRIIVPFNISTIVNGAPEIPLNAMPANNATNVLKSVNLTWNSSSDPEMDPVVYDFLLRTEQQATFTTVATNLSASNYSPALQFGTTYYWKIVAKDNKGNTSTGEPFKFTTEPSNWWNTSYGLRHKLTVTNSSAVIMPTGFNVRIHLDSTTTPTAAQVFNNSTASVKGNDVRVVYNTTTELDRFVQTFSSTEINIWFATREPIGAGGSMPNNYMLYYKNAAAVNPPSNLNTVLLPANDANTVGLWRLQENSGTNAPDYSGKNHSGTFTTPVWAKGIFGNAAQFGNNSYIEIPNFADYNLPGAFTVEAWANLETAGADFPHIVSKWTGYGGRSFMIRVTNGGQPQFYVDTHAGNFGVTSSESMTVGTWYHIAGVHDGANTMIIYINGVERGRITNAQPARVTTSPIRIGQAADWPGSPSFPGKIENVRLSNIARTNFDYGKIVTVQSANVQGVESL